MGDNNPVLQLAVDSAGLDNEEVVDYMESADVLATAGTAFGDDLDDDDNEDPELPVNIESCLLLNNVYIDSIDELKAYLVAKRRENESRQQELQKSDDYKTVRDVTINSFGYSHPNSLIPFMAPYFKDVRGLTAPPNADAIEMRASNRLLNESYVCANKPWSVTERERLQEIMETEALERIHKPLRDEKERLAKDKANIAFNLPRIEELSARIDDLNAASAKQIPMTVRWDRHHDWLRVATEMDTDHSDYDCELYWNNFLHPEVTKGQWTKEEDKHLEELVKEFGLRNWDKVSAELNTGRLPWQCCQRYQSELNRDLKRVGPLTKAEAETVEKVISTCRVGEYIPWHQVKYFIEGRTLPQIKHYWHKINVAKRGDQWSDDENKVLTAAVKKYGTHNWRKVTQYIPGRSNRQCRERYMMRLNFGADRKLGNWTADEDRLIIEWAPKYEFQWVKLERHILGRNARQIASRYELLVKYNKGKAAGRRSKAGSKATAAMKARMTRTLTVRNQLYEKIRQMINRQNKETENLDKILRIGRAKLAKRLEMERTGLAVHVKGRRKRSAVEENLDTKIIKMFSAYSHKSSPKKSIARSKQDHCVYDTTKNVMNELLTGQRFDSRTELANAIRLLISQTVTTRPKPVKAETVMTDTANELGDNDGAGTSHGVEMDTIWNEPPILPPNRTTMKGLRGLLMHSDYFSQTIAKSEIPLEQFRKALDGNAKYDQLFSQFKSLFAWPALLSTIEPPERSVVESTGDDNPLNTGDPPTGRRSKRGGHRKSWLSNQSSRMTEIRMNQTQLIESEMKRIGEQNLVDEESAAAVAAGGSPQKDEPLNETSSLAPWYVTKKDRKTYKLKSLDKSSFVFTRIKPKRD